MANAQHENVRAGYVILQNTMASYLADEVADYVARGWTPVGGVMVVPTGNAINSCDFYQALWYRNG